MVRTRANSLLLAAIIVCMISAAAIILPSCGGSSARSSNLMALPSAGYAPTGGLLPQLNTSSATRYSPVLSKWKLYQGTKGWTWISAIGSTKGMSASMSNPFKEIAIGIIPTDTYNGAGTVDFYVDGKKVSTLDLSQTTPFTGYSDSKVTYYTIAKDLNETTAHTVTMVIATGTVAFDGWRMKYKESYYIIDASEINTHIDSTISNTATLRAAIEEYYHEKKSYPNPSSGDVASYLYAARYLNSIPVNPFSGSNMTKSATDTYSAGDFRYTYVSATEYKLEVDGGAGTLVTVTPNSVKTELFDVKIDSPLNHTTTTNNTATFSGAATFTGAANMTVCCGLSGEIFVPLTSGPFSTSVTLKEGRNDISVTISDADGNFVKFGYTITKDTTAPSITVIEPHPLTGAVGSQVANIYTATSTVSIYAETGATVTFNGQNITESTKDAGVFSSDMQFATGSTQMAITATDLYNNKSSLNFVIIKN